VVHRVPKEEAHEKDHPDDRHVVRQRRDGGEVRVEIGEPDRPRPEDEQEKPTLLRPERPPADPEDEQDQHRRHQVLRRRQKIDDGFEGVDEEHDQRALTLDLRP
jgi:hypothetical protein